MMKKITLLLLLITCTLYTFAIDLKRVEPAFWWVGMKNTELQLLVHGDNIAEAKVQFQYPGVKLKQVVRLESPNYLFLYLDITKDAKPGTMVFNFSAGKKSKQYNYELKPRSTTIGAQGFSPADVMYLIMPDRFANGNPANDNWDGVTVDRSEPFARHGGDFEGIVQNLDYISDLGITTIWFNPVLENKMPGSSYHGYAITDFYKVDQRFGSNQEYCQMIEKIHQKGMKVVMDMIYNHCGSNHWWMGDFPSSDWLNHQGGFVPTTHNLWTIFDIHAPQSEIDKMTDGWFVPEMPDMNQRNPHLATYLIQNSIWWIEYARIDGIRHDTHPYADYVFLSDWCQAIQDEYPDFNIVGESWYLKAGPLAWWQRDSKLNEKQNTNLKTAMDFGIMNACEEAFDPKNSRFLLERLYELLAQDFLYADTDNILIFLDNHDLSRFNKAGDTDLDRYKQALAFLLTTRGIPQIYYGTEILMTAEKREGDGNLRKDFPGGWNGDAVNAFTRAGRTDIQNEAWDYLQKILQWRKTSKAVTSGKLYHYSPQHGGNGCYVYARVKDDSTVLVILNGTDGKQTLQMARYKDVTGAYLQGKDVITGATVNITNELRVSPKGVYILELY